MKKLKLLLIGITFAFCLTNINAYAKTMTPDEIENSAYVIGTHVFTRDTNETTGYAGKLTTSLIMLASQTINSSELDSMLIYYKTASGTWINGLTGATIEVPESFEINYINLELEEENSIVKTPNAPILSLNDGALSIDEETDMLTYQLDIYLDDMDEDDNVVDGVELKLVDYNSKGTSYDLKCSTVATILDSYTGTDLEIGKQYHNGYITFENTPTGTYTITARAYVLDASGNKTYSDWVSISINSDTTLSSVEIVNDYENPDYITKTENYYIYRLGIETPSAYVFKVSPQKFAYVVYEVEDNSLTQIGIYDLDEEFTLTVEKESVKTYYAQIGYYNANGKFISTTSENRKYFIIDTRSLTTPVLNASQDGYSYTELKNNGEFLSINSDFYEEQAEDTLDNKIEGVEIYRVYWEGGTIPVYELVTNTTAIKAVTQSITPTGVAYYTARVYATNENNEKVYSDFSDVVTVVRTPEIEVSDIVDGKVTVSLVNTSDYLEGVKFNVYVYSSTSEDTLLDSFTLNDGQISINVTEDIKIYVKAYAHGYNSKEYVYSAMSNEVSIDVD